MTQHIYMKKSEYDAMMAKEHRQRFLQDPPDGYSKKEIGSMSDDNILDMAYFLSEASFDFYEDDDLLPPEEPAVVYHIIDDSKDELDDPDILY